MENVMTNNRDRRIDYIEFPSNNMEATKSFYTQVFDWKFQDYGPDYISFSDGGIAGGFRKGEVPKLSSPLVVVFVDDLPATERRVKAAGGAITKEIFSFPGGSRFHFQDPNGNELAAWHED
jgi:predicted enzyme related to lactoylglutathione lyase